MKADVSVQTALFNMRAEAAFSQNCTACITGFICAPEISRDASQDHGQTALPLRSVNHPQNKVWF